MGSLLESGPLPAELTIEILEYLEYRELLRCRLVSRWLCATIDHGESFQYKIALATRGMSDNPLNMMTKGQKRDLLSQHRARWLSRDVKPNRDSPNMNIYASQAGPAWELVGGVLAQSKDRDTIEFVRLPSILRGVQEETRTVDLPCPHVDFTMDPSQDLLVVVEPWEFAQTTIQLRLLTMSTGKPHPGASTPILTFECHAFERPQYEIRVNGPYLGLLASVWAHGTISVWEWSSGLLQSRMLSNDHRHISSFVFLDDTYIVMALESDMLPTTNIVNPREGPRLEIIRFRGQIGPPWMLQFPRLCAGEDMEDMVLSCEPGPLYTPPPSEVPPFHVFDVGGSAGKGERVLVLNMLAIRSSSVLTVSLLSSKLLEVPLRPKTKDGITWVDWQDWGPSTALIDTMSTWEGLWPCIAYGTKEVILKPNGASEAEILVKDFSRVGAKWEQLRPTEDLEEDESAEHARSKARHRVITGELLNPAPHSLARRKIVEIFDEDVVSNLSHTQLEIPGRVSHRDQVMLSEDSLVVVKDGRWHAERLEVYSI
ncbi:hypothetical protein BC629DRAFT_1589866 [Irpex lacteus]|nr:hypothetical protein BC629DRAFT_1589866 [Irpex lacteus]